MTNMLANNAAPKTSSVTVCDQAQTAALLDFKKLVDAIAQAATELEAGSILSPERMVVPLGDGGVLLSMPATAKDIGIHKLVNVQPGNVQRQLPTINGMVTVCDAVTGQIKCLLDGPEVTGRRTAAVTLLAIRTLLQREPEQILLFGTGAQARHHVITYKLSMPCTHSASCGSEELTRKRRQTSATKIETCTSICNRAATAFPTWMW